MCEGSDCKALMCEGADCIAPKCEDVEGLLVIDYNDIPDAYAGAIKYCYDNGQLRIKINFLNGKYEGEWLWYHQSCPFS